MAKSKPAPKNKEPKQDVMSQATATLSQPEEVTADEKSDDLYQTKPDLCAEDIIINVEDAPKLIYRPRSTNVNLKKGDRVRGEYFKKLVEKDHVQGLQLCYKLTEKHLKQLEKERRERIGEIPPEWVKEAKRIQKQREEEEEKY